LMAHRNGSPVVSSGAPLFPDDSSGTSLVDDEATVVPSELSSTPIVLSEDDPLSPPAGPASSVIVDDQPSAAVDECSVNVSLAPSVDEKDEVDVNGSPIVVAAGSPGSKHPKNGTMSSANEWRIVMARGEARPTELRERCPRPRGSRSTSIPPYTSTSRP